MAFPEFRLPFSYNHLLFNPTLDPFAANGLGVPGVSGTFILDPPGPRGLGDPYEALLFPFNPPPIAFCNNGLDPGENGDPGIPEPFGLPLPDNGELE